MAGAGSDTNADGALAGAADDGAGAGAGNNGLTGSADSTILDEEPALYDHFETLYALDSDASAPLGSITIGGREIIIFPGAGLPSWALLDLLLTIAAVLIAGQIALRSFFAKKRRDSGNDDSMHDELSEESGEIKKHRPLWVVVAAIAGLFMVVLFLITQDMRLEMVIIDWWTLLFAIAFVVTLISNSLVTKRKHNDTAPESEPVY